MKAFCIKNYFGFEKGNYYNIISKSSVFTENDFITIESYEPISYSWYRFRLNKSNEYIENYIGENESYFYDYFLNVKEERMKKLKKIKFFQF